MFRASEPIVSAAGAGVIAAAVLWLLPHGPDWAAHVYQRSLFVHHGFGVWDNLWYGGRYAFVDYSVISYPLASLVGMHVLGLVSAVVAVVAFRAIVEREWPDAATWPSRLFAAAWPLALCTGALPFVLGAAFALVAIAMLQRSRLWLFSAAALATLAASPLAFVLLLVVCTAAGIARTSRRAVPAGAALLTLVVAELLVWRIFPSAGRFPFAVLQLLAVLAFCATGLALTWHVARARVLFALFAVYLVICVGSFVVPSSLGGNVERVRLFALPLIALVVAVRGWRPVVPAVVAIVLALSWNLAPVARSVTTAVGDPTSSRAYWAPALGYIRAHRAPGSRVEVVSTADHWEAAYLPQAGVPIARGWFRQSDFPADALFYRHLTARAYRAWLRRLAVQYVVLPHGPLDYSARREAAIVAANQPWLHRVFSSPTAAVYAVRDPAPLVRGPAPAHVISLTTNQLVVDVREAGAYRIAVRYSRFWRTSEGCLHVSPGGTLTLHAARAGVHVLDVAFTLETAVDALTNAPNPCR